MYGWTEKFKPNNLSAIVIPFFKLQNTLNTKTTKLKVEHVRKACRSAYIILQVVLAITAAFHGTILNEIPYPRTDLDLWYPILVIYKWESF